MVNSKKMKTSIILDYYMKHLKEDLLGCKGNLFLLTLRLYGITLPVQMVKVMLI